MAKQPAQSVPASTSGLKNRIASIALLIVVLSGCLTIMEIVARNLPQAERLGWNLVPVLPDRMEQIPEKGPHRRVVVVGDSFAEWMETSGGNFVRVAEGQLREQGQEVEFVNMGEAGSGLSDYYRNLVDYGPGLQADKVVIAVYLGNDLVPFRNGLPSPEDVKTYLAPPPYDRSWRRSLKKSVLLNLIYRQAKMHIPWMRSGFTAHVVDYLRSRDGKDQTFVNQRLAKLDPQLLQQAEADAINGWDLATALFNPDYYGNLADANTESPEGKAALAALADLRVLVRYAKTLAPQPLVVLIPPSPWAGERYHDYFRRLGYGHLGPTQSEPAILSTVKALLDEEGAPYLDLLPALRASPESVYLDRDIHFNSHGQDVAGHELARALAAP